MDKYRHTDDSQELDDVTRLILELKGLSDDCQEPFDYKAPAQSELESVEEMETEDAQVPVEEDKPAKQFFAFRKKETAPEYVQMDEVEAEPAEQSGTPAKRGLLPIWLVALINILVGGAVILTFAFFHHVLPAINSAKAREEAALRATEPAVIATEAPASGENPVEDVTEAPTELDLRTEWQKKFAEHFSDEIIRTDNSYKSPNVSITVETITYGEGKKKQTYHVADIYIGSIENFKTYVAGGDGGYFTKQNIEEMSQATDALIAISGDYITLQRGGFLMRNSNIFYETSNNDSICALFPDGTMETYEAREYTIDDIKNRGAIQVWSFGPTLLDENGEVRSRYDVPRAVSYPNPRSAIGYYEPGHYCFLVADGRQDGYAKGFTIPELAQIFKDLGCVRAYNLDGGGSAVMAFNHETYSKQSNGGRDLGDILLIRETPEFLATLPVETPEETVPAETAMLETVPAVTEGTETGEGVG